jgi:transcriptional regulator with XRE-family HTH domain
MNKTKLDLYFEKEFVKELKDESEMASRAIDIAMQIHSLRKTRGFTQKELANFVGVKQSNIARLENADYSGYTMQTLNKVASALSAYLSINLVPKEKEVNRYNFATTFKTFIPAACSPCCFISFSSTSYFFNWDSNYDKDACLITNDVHPNIRITTEVKHTKGKEVSTTL